MGRLGLLRRIERLERVVRPLAAPSLEEYEAARSQIQGGLAAALGALAEQRPIPKRTPEEEAASDLIGRYEAAHGIAQIDSVDAREELLARLERLARHASPSIRRCMR